MSNSKYITKEIIVSDNGALIYCISLYFLIHVTIYMYLVGKALCVPFSATDITKGSCTLVLLLPHISHTQKQKNESTTSAH